MTISLECEAKGFGPYLVSSQGAMEGFWGEYQSDLVMALAVISWLEGCCPVSPKGLPSATSPGIWQGAGGESKEERHEGGCCLEPRLAAEPPLLSPSDPGEDHDTEAFLREPVRRQPEGGALVFSARKPAPVSVRLSPSGAGSWGLHAGQPRSAHSAWARPWSGTVWKGSDQTRPVRGKLEQLLAGVSPHPGLHLPPFADGSSTLKLYLSQGTCTLTGEALDNQKALLCPRSRCA